MNYFCHRSFQIYDQDPSRVLLKWSSFKAVSCWEISHQSGTYLEPTFSDFNEIGDLFTYYEDK